MPTLLVKNASIMDGTGKPAYPGHLLADGESIANLAELVGHGSIRMAASKKCESIDYVCI